MDIRQILDELTDELKQQKLWGGSAGRPEEKAFLSTVPFFLDTMEFHQWLEYVLIPRLRSLLDKKAPLPSQLLVHPMAEESWRSMWTQRRRLIMLLRQLDEACKVQTPRLD